MDTALKTSIRRVAFVDVPRGGQLRLSQTRWRCGPRQLGEGRSTSWSRGRAEDSCIVNSSSSARVLELQLRLLCEGVCLPSPCVLRRCLPGQSKRGGIFRPGAAGLLQWCSRLHDPGVRPGLLSPHTQKEDSYRFANAQPAVDVPWPLPGQLTGL